jgi:short-subunit dehydrogenase
MNDTISRERYGPWAVIAGGSEGVGECFARRLAQAGINLVLLARRIEPLQDTARRIQRESGVQVRTVQVDLTQSDMLARVRAATDDVQVGLLIYYAGAAQGPRLLIEQTADEALMTVRLNAVGQTLLAQHFARGMAARGRGGLLLISSGAGVAGSYSLATYSGSKAFTQMFGESLWAELRPRGVDVLVLVLGRTRTPALLRTEIAQDGATADPDDMAAQGLANLGNGPVYAPPSLQPALDRLRAMPRAEATEAMSKGLRAQYVK